MHTVDVVDQLSDALIGVLPAQLCVADGLALGPVQQRLHVIYDDQKTGMPAQVNHLGQRTQQMPGVVAGDTGGREPQRPQLGQPHRFVAIHEGQYQIATGGLERRVPQQVAGQQRTAGRKAAVQHGIPGEKPAQRIADFAL